MKDIWNINCDWSLDNNTWLREERLEPYWSGVTYIPDNYFKYQKCLSGITYQYVNTLSDIYNKNAMVGKNWCIYNMYNEFDIINNFMVNMDTVDVCSTINLDLTQRYYTIDNAYLKTKHKVLLVNQNDTTENGLYNVDQRGYLISSNFLADSGNTFRYKGYVKLGDNKHKEYHLKNSGDYFPTLSQPSNYMLGKTYIIKNFFSYNLNTTNPVPKLIFTDYDIARHINPYNYSFYNSFTLPSFNIGDNINIKYHDYNYIITFDNTISDFTYSGIVSGTTIENKNDDWWWSIPPEQAVCTFVEVSSDFYTNTDPNNYVQFDISGYTNLSYKTFVKSKDNSITNVISLKDPIPLNILNDYYISGGTYTITNLQWSTTSDIQTTLNSVYQSKYFYVDSSLNVFPTYYKYNHYFDYDGLQFIVNGGSPYYFSTNNYYVKYKLFEQLNAINTSIFTNSYQFLGNMSLTSFTTGFTAFNEIQSSEYQGVYTKGTCIKIIPTNPSDMYLFRKNTFVNLNSTYKTLIVDYVPNEYFIIETYKSNSGLTITNIDTMYLLTDISDLLYSVYKNDSNSWYRERDDDLRKNICNAYSRIIENDINITKYTTALLTQDDSHKFILEMYNPESLYNNGGNITISYDPNLVFKPIELIEIGVDKHTKIPIPILNDNLSMTYDLLTGATSGTTTGSTSYDSFSFTVKADPVFNYTLYSVAPTTLNINWGDGGSGETITFNGYYVGSHSYGPISGTIGSQTSVFNGDLQYINQLSANGNNIISANLIKLSNLTSLDLSNNKFVYPLNITGLIYLTNLNLSVNYFLECDSYYNIIDSNGSLLNGNINTGGGGNASVTSSSSSARTSLNLKGWTLVYN